MRRVDCSWARTTQWSEILSQFQSFISENSPSITVYMYNFSSSLCLFELDSVSWLYHVRVEFFLAFQCGQNWVVLCCVSDAFYIFPAAAAYTTWWCLAVRMCTTPKRNAYSRFCVRKSAYVLILLSCAQHHVTCFVALSHYRIITFIAIRYR